jgi:hypothetical protein
VKFKLRFLIAKEDAKFATWTILWREGALFFQASFIHSASHQPVRTFGAYSITIQSFDFPVMKLS